MKILVFGASGSGTTTLAAAVAQKSDYVHLDTDDFYWQVTDPPYQQKVSKEIRQARLSKSFHQHKNVIISGSIVSWGEEWKTAFDLVVFIYLKSSKRLERLHERERKRYGDRLIHDTKVRQIHADFIAWTQQYDDPSFKGRSLAVHDRWLKSIKCPILRLDGELELDLKIEKVLTSVKE